jgi:radical SAM-linked protein
MAQMHHHRLRYEKTGRGIYISHLDTMAMFQRAFLRARLSIWQTEGFNKHAYISIALPLSVGFSSVCEVLEFDLESDVPLNEVPDRLNHVLPEGIRVVECYESRDPFKLLRLLDWTITLEYDHGTPEGVEAGLSELLSLPSLVIQKPSKKSKKGYTELDIIPMVDYWYVDGEGASALTLKARLAAQNPSLNPQLLMETFSERYPALKPDFIRYRREEIYLENGEKFR